MFNWIIQSSLKNRLLVITAYVIILLAGIFVVQRMTLDVLPEFAPPQVVIQTQSPGLSPEDVETLITFRIETAVNGTPGVDLVRSKSSAGLSTVIVVFGWGTNIYTARQLVNERIQEVKEQFPPGTESPVMLPITSAVSWLIKFALRLGYSQPHPRYPWDRLCRVYGSGTEAIPGSSLVSEAPPIQHYGERGC
jgi:Cu/Ag efflux pump CusA